MLSHRLRRAAAGAAGGGGALVKSVILDIPDNWGSSLFIGIRSVEFTLGGVVITNNQTLSTSLATTVGGNLAWMGFDTSLSKTGNNTGVSWQSAFFQPANQRLINILNDPLLFDGITINNQHNSGADTNVGAKNVKIYTSTDEITDITYGAAIPNSTLIFDGQFAQHPVTNTVDDQILTLF